MNANEYDVLATVNVVLNTTYTDLDDVPTSKLNRVYMILRITQILEEHSITEERSEWKR